MFGRQLDEFRRRPRPQQLESIVNGSVGIGAGNFDDLEVVVRGTLSGGYVSLLELVRCLLGGRLHFLVGILA